MICAPGFYCPQGGKRQIICPAGHYCPLGSVEPFMCLPLSICPTGSMKELHLVGVLCCILLDVILLCLWLWPWLRKHLSAKIEVENIETLPVPRLEEHKHELLPVLNESSHNVGLEVRFNEVSFCIKPSGKKILSGISGTAQEGSVLGIMGPSGSGKCE